MKGGGGVVIHSLGGGVITHHPLHVKGEVVVVFEGATGQHSVGGGDSSVVRAPDS